MVGLLIAWWIAGGALTLSACAVVLALIDRHRSRTLGERLARYEHAAERERKRHRPNLQAFLEQEVDVKWYLAIRNDGLGSARELTVSVDGSSLEQSPMIDARQLDAAKLSLVAGHGLVRIPLKTPTRPHSLQVELSWSDASGEVTLVEAELTGGERAPDQGEQR